MLLIKRNVGHISINFKEIQKYRKFNVKLFNINIQLLTCLLLTQRPPTIDVIVLQTINKLLPFKKEDKVLMKVLRPQKRYGVHALQKDDDTSEEDI